MAFGFALLLLITTPIEVARACPVQINMERVAWVELNGIPSSTPMDLVSFYDRTSGLQLLTIVLLIALTLTAGVLIVERAAYYARASRQTRLFISLANDALFQGRPPDVCTLAARYRQSPVACVLDASLTPCAAGVRFSPSGRHTAATVQVARIARGLATLGAIAMTTPVVGAAIAVEGLIRFLRVSSVLEISSDVLQNWIADWLIGLLGALVVTFIAFLAHLLLSATAIRLLLEIDRSSLAFISRIADSSERPRVESRLLVPATTEISLSTRPL
jgi:hypothetical protein